jgi:hypothetical protein
MLLQSSEGPNGKHGSGVYLTSLTPENGHIKIKRNNLDGAYKKKKYADKNYECYLKFRQEDLPDVKRVETKPDRDVWLYSENIYLNQIPGFFHGYTDNSEEEEYQSYRSSATSQQQKQLQSDGIEFSDVVAGSAAVIAIGAAAFGLFSAFRQARQNNQQ